MRTFRSSQTWNPHPKADYSLLPYFRTISIDEPINYSLNHFEDHLHAEFWHLTSRCQINWKLYFEDFEHKDKVWILIERAAQLPSKSIVSFLRPDWIDSAINKYNDQCPIWAVEFSEEFRKETSKRDVEAMFKWWDTVKTLSELEK